MFKSVSAFYCFDTKTLIPLGTLLSEEYVSKHKEKLLAKEVARPLTAAELEALEIGKHASEVEQASEDEEDSSEEDSEGEESEGKESEGEEESSEEESSEEESSEEESSEEESSEEESSKEESSKEESQQKPTRTRGRPRNSRG